MALTNQTVSDEQRKSVAGIPEVVRQRRGHLARRLDFEFRFAPASGAKVRKALTASDAAPAWARRCSAH